MNNHELTVGLLLGGISEERIISLQSSKAVYNALLELGYNVILIDPAYGKNQVESIEEFFTTKGVVKSKKKFLETFCEETFNDIDVVFIGLHGTLGEDGVVQSLLELLDIPYVGSDSTSSRLSMDKMISKILFDKNGVRTPKGFTANKKHYSVDVISKKINKEFSFPIIVKPSDQGSTIGLTVCKKSKDIKLAIEKCFAVSDSALIEEFISGREFTVGMLGETILPVLEIVPEFGLYDFEAKYESGTTKFIVPAEIDQKYSKEMQAQASKVFEAVHCRDYARADFILTEEGKTFCLEVNTLPGMTTHSLVPKMANAIGVNFNELIERLINFAINR